MDDLKKEFGGNFKMSDDFKAQMSGNDMFENLMGGNKDKSGGDGQDYENIKAENVKIEQSTYKMERDDSLNFTTVENDQL